MRHENVHGKSLQKIQEHTGTFPSTVGSVARWRLVSGTNSSNTLITLASGMAPVTVILPGFLQDVAVGTKPKVRSLAH